MVYSIINGIYIIQHGCLVFLHEIHASSVSP
nr:MAG TPA: hypothetical protein [Caudoviricetes sp.]